MRGKRSVTNDLQPRATPTPESIHNEVNLPLPHSHFFAGVRRKITTDLVSLPASNLQEQRPRPGTCGPAGRPHHIRNASVQVERLHRRRFLHVLVSNGIGEAQQQLAFEAAPQAIPDDPPPGLLAHVEEAAEGVGEGDEALQGGVQGWLQEALRGHLEQGELGAVEVVDPDDGLPEEDEGSGASCVGRWERRMRAAGKRTDVFETL